MADFVTLDDGGLAVKLDPEGQEAAIMITKDGEVSFVSVTPEDADETEGDESPPHVWLAEGIASALSDPELFEEIRAIAERAHELKWEPVDDVPSDCPAKKVH